MSDGKPVCWPLASIKKGVPVFRDPRLFDHSEELVPFELKSFGIELLHLFTVAFEVDRIHLIDKDLIVAFHSDRIYVVAHG